MEKLKSDNNRRDSFLASILSLEPQLIEEKMLLWSSSLTSKLTYNNLRGYLTYICRSLQPKNVESKILYWSASFSSYIHDNPLIFSVEVGRDNRMGGSDMIQTYINLPYLGAVSLDVFLFSSLAIISRVYMFWYSRQGTTPIIKKNGTIDDDDEEEEDNGRNNAKSLSPDARATIVKGYKDESLYKTIQECQDVKKSLRKVTDPEMIRKEKKRQITQQNTRSKVKNGDSSDEGYLGMSPSSLQIARKSLRRVDSPEEDDTNRNGRFTN